MKTFFFILALICSAIQVKSQTSITFHPKPEHISVSGKMMKYYTYTDKKDPTQFIVAALPGYVTFGAKSEDIGTLLDFYLNVLEKPSNFTNTRKLEIVGIGDLSGRIPRQVNLNKEKFRNAAAVKLNEWGFDCFQSNAFFENKNEAAEISIAGEIINFGYDTKGPGFQVSTIIKWSLFNNNKKKVIHSVLCAGFSNSQSSAPFEDELCSAIKNSVQGLMSDHTFQSIVLSTPSEESPSLNQTNIYLPIVKNLKELEYGEMINQVTESVVTVKTDMGHGSGFIISTTGYLITNHHVVEGSSSIELILNSGITLSGTIIKSDEARDIALIKINGKGFKPIPLIPKSSSVSIGMDVTAIGTPKHIELGQTVTKGIISGIREFKIKNNLSMEFLQTDVSVNAGNSGGPLITNKGEIVGVIVSKRIEVGVEGLAFAIPIHDALETLNIIFE